MTQIVGFPDKQRMSVIKQTNPSLVPSGSEALTTNTAYLEFLQFSNKTAVDQTVSVFDRQTTPREVVPTTTIFANTTVSLPMDRRYCPNGVSWIASDANSIIGYARWREIISL